MFLSKDKSGIYYLYYEGENGKRNRISTRTKVKSKAYSFIPEFKSRLKLDAESKVVPMTLANFRSEILRHSESVHSPKTTSNYRTTFKFFSGHFGDMPIGSLTRADIENYIEKRIRDTSVYAGRKDLAYLSASFRYALERKYVHENVCTGIRTPRIPEKMPLFLSQEEYQVLLSVIDNKDVADLVIFGVNTGCRQGEIVNLKWSQVDLIQKRVLLDNRGYMTKSKRIRSIPLNAAAAEVVKRRKGESTGEYVFTIDAKPVRPDRMNKLFKAFVVKAKLDSRLHFHCLRHTFASWLVMRGISLFHVQRLLGHRTPTVTQIYAHLTTDNLAATVEKLSEPSN